MRYIFLYSQAVYKHWVGLLSGIASIILTFVAIAFPNAPTTIFISAAVLCLVVAMFFSWLQELWSKEKAEAIINDAAVKQQRMLRIAVMLDHGRDLLRATSNMDSGNVNGFLAETRAFRNDVNELLTSMFSEANTKRYQSAFGRSGSVEDEIKSDIELLQSVKDALAATKFP